MAVELTKEQFESLPDVLQAEYKEDGGVYKNAAIMTLKRSNDDLNTRFNETDIKLKEFQQNQEQLIEEAKQKALDEAKTNKDVEAIEKQYQEQMADLEKRTSERVKSETLAEFRKEQSEKDAKNLAEKIAIELAVDGAKEDLTTLVGLRVKVNESGDIVFMNADGSASAMNKDEFKADVKERHGRLCKAELTTKGSGLASGNMGGSADKATGNAARDNLKARLRKHGLTK